MDEVKVSALDRLRRQVSKVVKDRSPALSDREAFNQALAAKNPHWVKTLLLQGRSLDLWFKSPAVPITQTNLYALIMLTDNASFELVNKSSNIAITQFNLERDYTIQSFTELMVPEVLQNIKRFSHSELKERLERMSFLHGKKRGESQVVVQKIIKEKVYGIFINQAILEYVKSVHGTDNEGLKQQALMLFKEQCDFFLTVRYQHAFQANERSYLLELMPYPEALRTFETASKKIHHLHKIFSHKVSKAFLDTEPSSFAMVAVKHFLMEGGSFETVKLVTEGLSRELLASTDLQHRNVLHWITNLLTLDKVKIEAGESHMTAEACLKVIDHLETRRLCMEHQEFHQKVVDPLRFMIQSLDANTFRDYPQFYKVVLTVALETTKRVQEKIRKDPALAKDPRLFVNMRQPTGVAHRAMPSFTGAGDDPYLFDRDKGNAYLLFLDRTLDQLLKAQAALEKQSIHSHPHNQKTAAETLSQSEVATGDGDRLSPKGSSPEWVNSKTDVFKEDVLSVLEAVQMDHISLEDKIVLLSKAMVTQQQLLQSSLHNQTLLESALKVLMTEPPEPFPSLLLASLAGMERSPSSSPMIHPDSVEDKKDVIPQTQKNAEALIKESLSLRLSRAAISEQELSDPVTAPIQSSRRIM